MPILLVNALVLLVIQTLFVAYLRSSMRINWFEIILVYVVTTVIYLFGMYSVFATFTQGLQYG